MKKKVILALLLIITFASVLRLYRFTSNPPGLYWDEAAIGYNAYSLLKTGRDEWGTPHPILFRSFDDYKAPLYIYLTVPFVKVFGLNEIAVRLPSVSFGILTVLTAFLLGLEISKSFFSGGKKTSFQVALLSSLFIAISPWHLQFSRTGFEASVSLAFVCLGTWLFLRWQRLNDYSLIPAALAFVASIYTYHSARVFTPLFLVVLGMIFIKVLWQRKNTVILALIVGAIALSPFLPTYFSKEGRARFAGENVLHEPGNVFENIQNNYLANLSADFLFFKGDQAGRHSVKKMGEFYLWQLPLFLTGIYLLLSKKNKAGLLLGSWALLGAVPPALTSVSPHAVRALMMVMPVSLICVLGAIPLLQKIRKSRFEKLILVGFSLVFVYYFALYLELYQIQYPKAYAVDWQDGAKSAVKIVERIEDNYDAIYLYQELHYIHLLFYKKYDPVSLQQSGHDIKNIGKFHYLPVSTFPKKSATPGKTLIVFPYWMVSPDNPGVLRDVRMGNGQTVYRLYAE